MKILKNKNFIKNGETQQATILARRSSILTLSQKILKILSVSYRKKNSIKEQSTSVLS